MFGDWPGSDGGLPSCANGYGGVARALSASIACNEVGKRSNKRPLYSCEFESIHGSSAVGWRRRRRTNRKLEVLAGHIQGIQWQIAAEYPQGQSQTLVALQAEHSELLRGLLTNYLKSGTARGLAVLAAHT